MKMIIPEFSLVVLIGASGSGKSHFAKEHFLPTEILSSDYCRGLVSDDENDQTATQDAFEVLHYIAAKRLQAGRLTVIDATNVQRDARKSLIALARQHDCMLVAIVLNPPESVCVERNSKRPDRNFGRRVVAQHRSQLRRSLRGLKREGFRYVYQLRTVEEVEEATIERTRLWSDKRDLPGPFDIIGDIHGCADELIRLLEDLGYRKAPDSWGYEHPEGRMALFLGDIVDRGPRILDSYRIVRAMVEVDSALCLPGNHDTKLVKKLRGKNVQLKHGLAETMAEIESLPEEDREKKSEEIAEFFYSLVGHYVLDQGKLVVAHAGMKEEYQGRASGRVRSFALFGETTGEIDEFGLPVRCNWAADYRGKAVVVYGHTPVPEPEWLNRTINIDTGCVFGGKLTALRYPELEIVSVDAARTYCEPAKPIEPADTVDGLSAQQEYDDVLDMEDVSGKRIVNTRLRPNITIREENATAALEAMSRFAVDPKWLVYLPPTMSPTETSKIPDLLEHPEEAFAYYRKRGVDQVICQEKHMGSRAVVVVCRDEDAARKQFGVVETNESCGICYTRTGRRFFEDRGLESGLLKRVRDAFEESGLWEELGTTWAVLDCELMPWSMKAQALLSDQYAAVGAAGQATTTEAVSLLETADSQGVAVKDTLERYRSRREMIGKYTVAYRQYCWPVDSIEDLKLAPFHLLASEGSVHVDTNHRWHMQTLARLCQNGSSVLLETPYCVVDLGDDQSCAAGISWWEDLTGKGGEGMVVKPLDFVVRGKKELLQPALKCRGREYLRIIYGPEYTDPESLERLKSRGLSRKRSMAIREFALGVEALERFVRKEPLRRVHECVFGVLAMESEPVDPRL